MFAMSPLHEYAEAKNKVRLHKRQGKRIASSQKIRGLFQR